jgi:hypothetical protein
MTLNEAADDFCTSDDRPVVSCPTQNRFRSLVEEFDRLADTLRNTEDAAEPRQILRRMRSLVADLERIVRDDYRSVANVAVWRIT